MFVLFKAARTHAKSASIQVGVLIIVKEDDGAGSFTREMNRFAGSRYEG